MQANPRLSLQAVALAALTLVTAHAGAQGSAGSTGGTTPGTSSSGSSGNTGSPMDPAGGALRGDTGTSGSTNSTYPGASGSGSNTQSGQGSMGNSDPQSSPSTTGNDASGSGTATSQSNGSMQGDNMGGTSSDGAASRYSTDLSTLPNEPTAAGPGGMGDGGYSWLPYTTSGYVGLSLGTADIDGRCVTGLECEDPNGAVHVFTGGMFNRNFGLQLGYFRLNDADRNGGKTKVSGVNLVLTGVAPLSNTVNLVGRVGGTYGWTDVSVGAGVVAARGDETGFGAAYGVGLAWDFNRNWSATLDWDRHHLKFPGDDKKNTDIATIGVKYRF